MPGSGSSRSAPARTTAARPGAPAPAALAAARAERRHASARRSTCRRRRPTAAGSRAAGRGRPAARRCRPSRRRARCARCATGTPARRSRPAAGRSWSSSGSIAVVAGRPAPRAAAAAEDVGDQRQPPGARVDRLEDERRERHVARGDGALRQELAERLDDDVRQPLHREVPRAERRREDRVEEAALGRDDAHAAGQPGVLRHVRRRGTRARRSRRRRARSRRGTFMPEAICAAEPGEVDVPASPSSTVQARVHPHRRRRPRSPRRRGSPPPRRRASGQERKAASARRAVCSSSASMPRDDRVQAVRRRELLDARHRRACRRRAARRGRRASRPGRARWPRSARTAPARGRPSSTSFSGREDQPLLEQLGALRALGAGEAAADVDVVGDRAGVRDDAAAGVERA